MTRQGYERIRIEIVVISCYILDSMENLIEVTFFSSKHFLQCIQAIFNLG